MDHDEVAATPESAPALERSAAHGDEFEATDVAEEIGDPQLEIFHARAIERVSRWKLVAAAVVVLVVVGGAVFGWAARAPVSTLPALDEAAVRVMQTEIDGATELPAHRRRALAGRALATIERRRLPAVIISALEESASLTEWERARRLRAALSDVEVQTLWRQLCPSSFDLESTLAGRRSGVAIYQACGLHRFPLLSSSQVVTSPGEDVLMAHLVWVYLDEHAALTDAEARALRAMAQGTVEATPALPFR